MKELIRPKYTKTVGMREYISENKKFNNIFEAGGLIAHQWLPAQNRERCCLGAQEYGSQEIRNAHLKILESLKI